eukprot:jgi/Chrzof1/7163/Cz02g13130.t1
MHLVASSPPGLLVQEQLSAGVSHFPRSAPVLVKLMSGLATTQFKWTRVPAVVVFGSMAPDQQGLELAATHNIPISPSMVGPHADELLTQLEVFFKQNKYPENKCFVLTDWGFIIFAADVDEAVATFNETVHQYIVHDQTADIAGQQASRVFSIAHAFKRLGSIMSRTQSEPVDVLAQTPKATAGAAVFSEPTSPTLGAPAALRSHIGSPPSCATLPDDISKIPSVSNRKNSVQNSIPSFQTGMRPW